VSGTDNIVAQTAERIFSDLADPQTINRGEDGAWKRPLWQALAEAGLPLAWTREEHGGSGASIADGFAALSADGRFAAPAPLAETLLASWLLSLAGMASTAGAMTVMPAHPHDRVRVGADGTLSGQGRAVPRADEAEAIVVLADDGLAGRSVALVMAGDCRIGQAKSFTGQASNPVVLDRVRPLRMEPAPEELNSEALMLMGAVVRSVQTAGALEAVLAMSVRYANERVAFERPIGKFQAVQHNLARLAGEVAAAMTAAGSAADAVANASSFDNGIFLEAASAKIRCAEAAQEGASIAHQVHGAIGFTKEHMLHRYTMKMLAWRDDFGNESDWAVRLGNLVAAAGATEFWPLVASR
jgi:acyl-CoA dehydrogenase